jgi:pimeloyl-ACP methyl ester carboxylesterase
MSTRKRTHSIIIVLSIIAITGIGGHVYQAVEVYRDKVAYPAPGTLVNIEGHKMHIQERGEGLPSVILDAGTGSFSLMWFSVTDDVAKFSRVYAYDRAGQGWSEESPLPRTATNMAHELHLLLEAVKAPKPYIMVGHSLGGGIAQVYANTYPDEVFGLVLVDAGHEDTAKRVAEHNLAFKRCMTGFTIVDPSHPEFSPTPLSQRIFLWLTSSPWRQRIAEYTGLQRLYLQRFYATPGKAQYEVSPAMRACLLRPSTFRTTSHEITDYKESGIQLSQLENQLAHKPLIVIGNGRGFFYNPLCHTHMTLPEMEFNNEIWFPLQKQLAEKSSKGKLIIAQESGHRIQDTEPHLIVNAIKELVEEYKATALTTGHLNFPLERSH